MKGLVHGVDLGDILVRLARCRFITGDTTRRIDVMAASTINSIGTGDQPAFEICREFLNRIGWLPVLTNEFGDRVDSILVALMSKHRDLGKQSYTTAGEAEQAINLKNFFVSPIDQPSPSAVLEIRVVKRNAKSAITQSPQHVQVRKPATKEEYSSIAHTVCSLRKLVEAAGRQDQPASHGKMTVPWDGEAGQAGADDFKRRKHDGSR